MLKLDRWNILLQNVKCHLGISIEMQSPAPLVVPLLFFLRLVMLDLVFRFSSHSIQEFKLSDTGVVTICALCVSVRKGESMLHLPTL